VGTITASPKASNDAANGFQYLLDACDFNAVEFIKCSQGTTDFSRIKQYQEFS